jgi:hypothetical protein
MRAVCNITERSGVGVTRAACIGRVGGLEAIGACDNYRLAPRAILAQALCLSYLGLQKPARPLLCFWLDPRGTRGRGARGARRGAPGTLSCPSGHEGGVSPQWSNWAPRG